MAENFTPGETVSLSASAASASVAFTLAQSASYPDCLVTNAGSSPVFVGFGSPALLPGAGALNATPVLPGESMVLRKGSASNCCAVTVSGTALVYFTAGQGN